MRHTVLIVDDEPPARAKLRRFLEPVEDFAVVAEADSVESAIVAVRGHGPALLYLDIQLGRDNGFAVLEAIGGEFEPHVVFTTAYAEYGVRAFEVQALDYLLKPFDRERFLTSLARVRAALAESDRGDLEERVRRLLAGQTGRPAPLAQVAIRERGRVLLLKVEDIEYVSAAGNYVEIFAHGRAHLLREPLTRFAAQLDATQFVRVHRSHLVRIGALVELNPLFSGDYELTLESGARLPMSRRYKALLPAALRDRL
jgi:two-component system LytT family response regulator